ncbi:MAG: prepilin-type N-terminal cleavage/methylation domain-containing protein [Pontibacterium sp.]
MHRPVAEGGFTLVELIVTMVVTSIALVAIVYSWGMSAQFSSESTWQAKAAYLGQTYLEEVLSKRFDENSAVDGSLPCGSGTFNGQTMPACSTASQFGVVANSSTSRDGEARENFDDVDDYHNLTETPMTVLDSLFSGNVNPYANYSVTITVAYDNTHASPNTMVKRITVSVLPPSRTQAVNFTAYKGNY